MKRTIAIVCGGDTSEFQVSLRSAQGIYSFIDKEKYTLYIVEMHGLDWHVQLPDGNKAPIDRNDFSFQVDGKKVTFDFAYITIHGTPGEDGRLQGYFDLLHIPYSCCGVLAAALTYDKFACNQYLKVFGVRIAESLVLRQGQSISDEDVIEKIGLPCFIKPSLGGSSFGVTKVKTKEQIQPAIVKAFGEAQEVLVEAFMEGTEVTCGCYKTKKNSVVFPITEVVTENEFFDYDAKYNGQVSEITPARISDDLTHRIQTLTSAIYDILGASGIIRVDYIITAGDKINLLEVNTTPGMTATSFIPQQVRAAGLDIKDVMPKVEEIQAKQKAEVAPEEKYPEVEPKEEITIDDFDKVQIRVGEVLKCEPVPKAKKLLVSQIRIGNEVRQIVSGIAKYYKPEEMVGKKVAVITNLKPCKLCGVESQGMILAAADDDGNLSVMTLDKDMPAGSEIC